MELKDGEVNELLEMLEAHPAGPRKRRKFGEVPMPENVFERTLTGFLAILLKGADEPVKEEYILSETEKVFDSLRKLSGSRYSGSVKHTVLTCLRTLKPTFQHTPEGWKLTSQEAYDNLKSQTIQSLEQRYIKNEKKIINDQHPEESQKDKFIALSMKLYKRIKKDITLSQELKAPIKVTGTLDLRYE